MNWLITFVAILAGAWLGYLLFMAILIARQYRQVQREAERFDRDWSETMKRWTSTRAMNPEDHFGQRRP